jgi:hypothetical protein
MDSRQKRICHDLKTERHDVGRPLPGILRLLPIGTYFAAAASLALSGLLFWQFKQAQVARDGWRSAEAEQKREQAALSAENDSVTREAKRAEDVRKWVQGSDPMQELVVAVVRSMRPTSSISDFGLVRDKDDPKKISFSMQISAGGPAQLDETLGKLASALNYRPYFAQQKQEKGGEIAYSATLIKQEKRESQTDQAANTVAPIGTPGQAK